MKDRDSAVPLEARVQQLKDLRRTSSARGSGRAAHRVRAVLKAIEHDVLPQSAERALALAEKILTLGDSAWISADDRDGSVELALRKVCRLWLSAAAVFKSRPQGTASDDSDPCWVERIYTLYMSDQEGVCDQLLAAADVLLDPAELRTLVARFEDCLAAERLVSSEESCFAHFKAVAALNLLAEPLRDPVLYERSIRVYLPEPSPLRARDIATCYLMYGDPLGAIRWLQRPWGEPLEELRYRLLDRAYQLSGNLIKQLAVLRERYRQTPSLQHFTALQELLPDEERCGMRAAVAADAARALHIGTGIRLLLGVGDIQAAEELLLARGAELDGADFEFLTPLAEDAERAQGWLVATMLLRAMLDNVLENSRVRAYGVAAGYLRALRRIAAHDINFKGLQEPAAHEAALRIRHERKSAFWSRMEPSGAT